VFLHNVAALAGGYLLALCDGLRVGQGPERSGDCRRGGAVGAVRGGNAMKVSGAWQEGQIRSAPFESGSGADRILGE
jgi:hypothetical protein